MNTALIFTDDIFIRKHYEKTLKMFNFKILGMATDKEELLKIYDSLMFKPNIILIDYDLSHQMIIEISKDLISSEGGSNIIVINNDHGLKKELYELGVSEVIDNLSKSLLINKMV